LFPQVGKNYEENREIAKHKGRAKRKAKWVVP
jgi:hypothetical protein